MKVKNIFFAVVALAIAGNLEAKNMHKVFGADDKIVKGSGKIEIYMIDPIPVMSIDQIQGQNYVYDYKVIQSAVLKKKSGAAIYTAVLDTNQYIYGVSKKCPFMGKYAIRFQKGKKSITIIISDLCAKAIIFCPGSIIDKKHIDLIDNSKIVATITAGFNPVVEKK